MIKGQHDQLAQFMAPNYVEHNPNLTDGIASLLAALIAKSANTQTIDYHKIHRVLAEGNFVLAVSEGENAGVHSAFYDLFRVANGKIAEHWDTTEKVAPKEAWKNDNGKF
ncbi:MAG: nuclear transport factor 2 family protein [Amylibacter sp.]